MMYIGDQKYVPLINSNKVTPASPDHYDAEIEYLGSLVGAYTDHNSGPYIDTKLYGELSLDFEIKLMFTDLNSDYRSSQGTIFGGRIDFNNTGYQLTSYNKNTTSSGHFMYASYPYGNNNTPTLDLVANEILTIKKEGRTFTKASGNTFTLANTSFRTVHTIYVFGLNTSTPQEFARNLRIYSLKFSKGEVLLRDYIPVRVGQIGYLYDKVSGRLFGNKGTGEFILGPDKIQ